MLATMFAVLRLLRAIGRALAEPATRGVVLLAALLLAGGTAFYARAEGWSVVDALYFSVVTLTTIGYGDLAPTSDATKLFTVVYSLAGIGVIAAFVTSLALVTRADAGRLVHHRHRSRPTAPEAPDGPRDDDERDRPRDDGP